MSKHPISDFIKHHYRHFNSATLVEAAQAYKDHLNQGNKMMITLAGAMSTAELGISLAEMIRREKVHAISCTGANLEEDIFNLVAHEHYRRVPHYRDLTPQQEVELLENKLNRVTDTCIPEEEAMRRVEGTILEVWQAAEEAGQRKLPHEHFYAVLRDGKLKKHYQIDPKNSWLVAAQEKNLPIFTPGWEDSTLGNIFTANVLKKKLKGYTCMASGLEAMESLAKWYQETSAQNRIGFFQIGGGIAGDFPICVVPMLRQDMKLQVIPHWSYFCQISDSTTSYGSYSGAVPNEKITWDKLSVDTPRFVIESDASIVAPLMFAYILEW